MPLSIVFGPDGEPAHPKLRYHEGSLMDDLLIHSMSEFSEIISSALRIASARNIVEIGAEFGGTSSLLADHAAAMEGELVSIDPCPQQAFIDWCAANPAVRHVAAPSLEVITSLANVDAWVIDGDHNWFTVFNELTMIDAVCQRDAKSLLCFVHDVTWPSGRRDSYYTPDRIPEAYRQPFDYTGGATLGQNGLINDRGFRGHGQFAWALQEGGPKNGVKTAVEDFIKSCGRDLAYVEVPAVFGLGILFDRNASWSDRLADHLLPWHENALLASLERNRLANYLTVIEWQDREAERTDLSA